MTMIMQLVITMIVLALAPVFGQGHYRIAGPLKGPYLVQRVYDGDTLRVGGGKVRLVLVDTPESTSNKRAADANELALGRKAKAFAEELVRKAGNSASLEVAPEARDRYGRLLAWVYLRYLEGTTPWVYQGRRYTSLNYELVRQGWAEVFVVGSANTRYLDAYREAQEQARRLSLGLWAVYQRLETRARVLPVRIRCAVYNPPGPDEGREEIWLEVRQPVDLTGWAVGDDDGLRLPLSGPTAPGIHVVRIPGEAALSNRGDTLLLWRGGEVVDRFAYRGRKGEERTCRRGGDGR